MIIIKGNNCNDFINIIKRIFWIVHYIVSEIDIYVFYNFCYYLLVCMMRCVIVIGIVGIFLKGVHPPDIIWIVKQTTKCHPALWMKPNSKTPEEFKHNIAFLETLRDSISCHIWLDLNHLHKEYLSINYYKLLRFIIRSKDLLIAMKILSCILEGKSQTLSTFLHNSLPFFTCIRILTAKCQVTPHLNIC